MPRSVTYRLVLPNLDANANGRFQDRSANNNQISRTWLGPDSEILPPVGGRPPNSAALRRNDDVSIRVWAPANQAGVDNIRSIQITVIIGRDSHSTQQRASPFGQPKPKCVFISTMGVGLPWQAPGGGWFKEYNVILGRIVASEGHYEFMLGAIVTMNDGTTYEFGHDPECDVGMEGN